MLEEPFRLVETAVFVEIEGFSWTCGLFETVFDKLVVLLTRPIVAVFGRETMLERARHAGSFEGFRVESERLELGRIAIKLEALRLRGLEVWEKGRLCDHSPGRLALWHFWL